MLPLEILLSFVSSMTDRLDQGDEAWPSVSSILADWTGLTGTEQTAVPADILTSRKERKGVLLTGAAMFNVKPKQGLAFLASTGIITADEGDERQTRATARFLRHSSRLDKKHLGEYISRPDQIELLKAFIGLFEFRGVSWSPGFDVFR